MHSAQKLINHVALVLDGSLSMRGHSSKLIEVADEQTKHLAFRSEELNQETRVSIYLFNDNVECLIFDMDVMRLPSIADLYSADGNTALIDAVLKSQDDLATTSQIYGDHAFLTFVLTDGQENRSHNSMRTLANRLSRPDDNWTIGFLVPNSSGVAYMRRLGADAGSISVWDTTSAAGLLDAASTIRTATDNFMTNRASGVRGSRNVFSTGVDAVNKKTVTKNLIPLARNKYEVYSVFQKSRIDDFVARETGRLYRPGIGYYQLTKTEQIQPQKNIMVVDRKTGTVYAGPQARHLIGLPDDRTVKVKPDYNPDYEVFVESTSWNRNLIPGQKLLVTA